MTQDSNDTKSERYAAIDHSRERFRRTSMIVFFLAACLILAFAMMTSFGVLKIASLTTMLGLSLVSVFDKRFYWLPRLVVLLTVTYTSFLVVDLGVWALRYRLEPRLSLRGMCIADPTVGFRLNPNWRGTYDDGVIRAARYVINSLGHRDAEPAVGDVRRIFVLGDSFAFGNLLDQDETIDSRMEQLSGGEFEAYNLGVEGYGAPAAVHSLASTTLPGESAIYLFYENDLRNDGLATERNTVHRGFLVRTQDDEGRQISASELDEQVDAVLDPLRWLKDAVFLRHVLRSIKGSLSPERWTDAERRRADGDGPLGYAAKNVQLVVEHTRAMQSLAFARRMKFVVLVIPALREVVAGRHDDRVGQYVAALQDANVSAIDPFAEMSPSDYYAHDGHFSPQGAEKIATRLVMWLREVATD